MRKSKYGGITNINHPDRKIYECWRSMKQRCYSKNFKAFKNYGGRGITVCDEWLNDFLSFYDWSILNGWKEGLQLDRINNNGNYEPSNCQFITPSENLAIGKLRKRSDNKSGYVGISLHKSANKWQSNITINKKQIHLGYFITKEEALQARINAELLYFGEQRTNLN